MNCHRIYHCTSLIYLVHALTLKVYEIRSPLIIDIRVNRSLVEHRPTVAWYDIHLVSMVLCDLCLPVLVSAADPGHVVRGDTASPVNGPKGRTVDSVLAEAFAVTSIGGIEAGADDDEGND
jgi:hypothetical protein